MGARASRPHVRMIANSGPQGAMTATPRQQRAPRKRAGGTPKRPSPAFGRVTLPADEPDRVRPASDNSHSPRAAGEPGRAIGRRPGRSLGRAMAYGRPASRDLDAPADGKREARPRPKHASLPTSRFRSSRGYGLIWVGSGCALAESADRSEYVVGGFHPPERSRVVVDGVDVVEDGAFGFGDRPVDAAPDLPLGRQAEEPLDPVEPRRRCRDEVDMPARALGKPVTEGMLGYTLQAAQDRRQTGLGKAPGASSPPSTSPSANPASSTAARNSSPPTSPRAARTLAAPRLSGTARVPPTRFDQPEHCRASKAQRLAETWGKTPAVPGSVFGGGAYAHAQRTASCPVLRCRNVRLREIVALEQERGVQSFGKSV